MFQNVNLFVVKFEFTVKTGVWHPFCSDHYNKFTIGYGTHSINIQISIAFKKISNYLVVGET